MEAEEGGSHALDAFLVDAVVPGETIGQVGVRQRSRKGPSSLGTVRLQAGRLQQ
jgi:hypothetical protein